MTILSEAIGADRFEKIASNPGLFVRAFDRTPWDYQDTMLQEALARDSNGKFDCPIVIISLPRQNGKSTLSAWAALWRLYCEDNQQIVSVANDKPQAAIILNDARRIVRGSDVLFSLIDGRYGLGKSEIRLTNGNSWIIKSADSVASRGLRPSVICYDELGWTRDRALYDVLSSAQAAQSNPLTLITSTVGPIKAGILWDLFELAREGNPKVKLLYETENLSPLITDEYLERQRAVLPPHVFAREHQNLWGEGSDAYCTDEDWRRATSEGDTRVNTHTGPGYTFVDLGWVHDETAIATSTRRKDGKIAVISLDTFKGSQSHPVEFAAVEGKLVDLAGKLGVKKIRIESPQGVAISQRLNLLDGVAAEVIHPTAKSQQETWGSLYTRLKNGTVLLPNDALLRRQLLTLTIKTTATGWRVEDVPAIHQDRAMAVAGAVNLIAASEYTPLPEQPEQASKFDARDFEATPRWQYKREGWTTRY